MTTPSRKSFKTANLTLASYLSLNDKPYRLIKGKGRMATWEFDSSQVASLVSEFEKGKASVEPQGFHHCVTTTRRVLFSFLNSKSTTWGQEKTQSEIKCP